MFHYFAARSPLIISPINRPSLTHEYNFIYINTFFPFLPYTTRKRQVFIYHLNLAVFHGLFLLYPVRGQKNGTCIIKCRMRIPKYRKIRMLYHSQYELSPKRVTLVNKIAKKVSKRANNNCIEIDRVEPLYRRHNPIGRNWTDLSCQGNAKKRVFL